MPSEVFPFVERFLFPVPYPLAVGCLTVRSNGAERFHWFPQLQGLDPNEDPLEPKLLDPLLVFAFFRAFTPGTRQFPFQKTDPSLGLEPSDPEVSQPCLSRSVLCRDPLFSEEIVFPHELFNLVPPLLLRDQSSSPFGVEFSSLPEFRKQSCRFCDIAHLVTTLRYSILKDQTYRGTVGSLSASASIKTQLVPAQPLIHKQLK